MCPSHHALKIETESARNTQINHICDSAGGGRKSSICLGFLLAGANCMGYPLIYQGCLRHSGDQPLEAEISGEVVCKCL